MSTIGGRAMAELMREIDDQHDAWPNAPALPSATFVVPCYNEAERLRPEAFAAFSREHPMLRLIFVDDGSIDGTAIVIRRIVELCAGRAELMSFEENRGQGEAVRAGMCRALERGETYVGFWDADLAAPLEEIPRMLRALEQRPECEAVFGSRISLLGTHIERRLHRRYLGRLFAMTTRLALNLDVYDTQCGAKLFRRTPHVEAVLADPFASRWLFDVEILVRLVRLKGSRRAVENAVLELPLRRWRDVAGSKLRAGDFVRAPLEVLRIRRELGR